MEQKNNKHFVTSSFFATIFFVACFLAGFLKEGTVALYSSIVFFLCILLMIYCGKFWRLCVKLRYKIALLLFLVGVSLYQIARLKDKHFYSFVVFLFVLSVLVVFVVIGSVKERDWKAKEIHVSKKYKVGYNKKKKKR